ncbi:GGDEF domain-containing protein [Sphingomonas sp. LaA6.9]|uniref:GGDEF domain-containing protein n=1 Tax=Sphingomonas sp. LaA6.9 TaxID=2919914 RepID=UPI001F4FD328|nr:GGDEF domain-containing protein [Sphingomonas sp. LaA6.9]MCJ8158517.1 diguanylate cyclase [Sphingomonas sp. LaA6.9]
MAESIPLNSRARETHEDVGALRDENEILRTTLADMRARVEELERLADSDTLTPLPNRRYFLRAMSRVLAHVARHGTPAVAMFVDLDGLKQINDQHGHGAGDAALIHVANLLRRHIRVTDVVARIGGDEFGLLLDQLDEADAERKARSLEQLIEKNPLELKGKILPLAVSIGSTTLRSDDSTETALARADARMYGTKRG